MVAVTSQTNGGLPPVEKWLTQGIRITSFLPANTEVDPSEWWREVVGDEPESQTTQPKVRARIDEGPFEQWRLQLTVQPGRIDWRLNPPSTDGLEMELMATLGVFTSAVQTLRDLAVRWAALDGCPPSTRLALGATLLQPVADRQEGYARLAQYLAESVNLDPEESRDFLYRINRRRMLTVHQVDIPINRLNTWQVVHFARSATLQMPGREPTPVLSAEAYALRLELDINTAAEFAEQFAPGQFGAVLNVLLDCGKEIAAKGDIA